MVGAGVFESGMGERCGAGVGGLSGRVSAPRGSKPLGWVSFVVDVASLVVGAAPGAGWFR
jgi:hypothetical protein